MTRRWIPNILTSMNLFAGILAIFCAFDGQDFVAFVLILWAAVFDSVDGRVARRLNAANEFGKQLDSFSDLVSFGIAPAALLYLLCFNAMGWGGYVLAAIFPVCGALRLVRFNTGNVKQYYLGLPITAAGSLAAGIAYFGDGLPVAVQGFIVLLLSMLMISSIRIPKMHI